MHCVNFEDNRFLQKFRKVATFLLTVAVSGNDVETVAGIGCVRCNGGTDVDQTAVRCVQLEDISWASFCSGSEQFCNRNVAPHELHKDLAIELRTINMTILLATGHILVFFQGQCFGT